MGLSYCHYWVYPHGATTLFSQAIAATSWHDTSFFPFVSSHPLHVTFALPCPCHVLAMRPLPSARWPSTVLAPSIRLSTTRSFPSTPMLLHIYYLLYSLPASRLIPNLLLPSSFHFSFFEKCLVKYTLGAFSNISQSLRTQPWKQKSETETSNTGRNIHGRFGVDCGLWSMVNVATISLSSVILKASVFVSYQYTCHCVIHSRLKELGSRVLPTCRVSHSEEEEQLFIAPRWIVLLNQSEPSLSRFDCRAFNKSA